MQAALQFISPDNSLVAYCKHKLSSYKHSLPVLWSCSIAIFSNNLVETALLCIGPVGCTNLHLSGA